MDRTASVQRKTSETDIAASLRLDGTGDVSVSTGVGFLDHMLTLMARHGFFDLDIRASGDLKVDPHHTVEDTGLVLGQAFDRALGNRGGIRRVGSAFMPMDETLVSCHIDICGRPTLAYRGFKPGPIGAECFNASLFGDFFTAFVQQAKASVHLQYHYGRSEGESDLHHMYEAAFKAFGRALDAATGIEPRSGGSVPSTKGTI